MKTRIAATLLGWGLLAGLLVPSASLAATRAAKKPPEAEPASAIELGAPFADSAIFQRQMPVPVWGWSEPGTKVTVEFAPQPGSGQAGQKKTATSGQDGKWIVRLDPLEASAAPAEMVISDSAGNKVTLKDLLVGEVWMASGQSNMQWEAANCNVGRVLQKQIAERVAAGKEAAPVIREAKVTNVFSSLHPVEHAQGEWSCEIGSFSAIAYAFAYELYRELGVPIGILNCAFSTTQIEAWTPREGFAGGTDAYARSVYQGILETDPTRPEHKAAWNAFYRDVESTIQDNQQRVKDGLEAQPIPTKTPGNLQGNRDACWMFNAKINPMIPYAIRGAIWNQGYANSGAGMTYYSNLHSLVRGWRKVWDRPDLPVYFHQFYCPGYNDELSLNSTAEMRLGTALARDIPCAGMASQIDVSGAVHYYSKAVPGQRLALHALKNQYGKKIVADGPIFRSYRVEDDKLIVEFDNADGGLLVAETGTQANTKTGSGLANPTIIENGADEVTLFYIADGGRVWHRAKLQIDGEKVVLTAPGVSQPRGVAYACNGVGWLPNLYNRALLPMTPFIYYDHKLVTSDTWPDDPVKVAGAAPDPQAGGLRYEYRKMPILSAQFRDNAVLQADAPVTIWGSAVHDWGYEAKGKAVIQFSFAGIEKAIPVQPGMREWQVTLEPMPASAEPRTLRAALVIDGELAHERVCENVVIGDVWYVSAPFSQNVTKEGPGQIRVMKRNAKRSLFDRPSRFSVCVSTTPDNRFDSEWQSPNGGFAGALGQRIHEKTGKPVGIIFMHGQAPNVVDGKDRSRDLELKHWIGFDGLKNAPSLMDDYRNLAAVRPGNPYYDDNARRYVAQWKKYWGESVPQLMGTKRPMNGAAWGSYPTLGASVTSDAAEAYNVMVHCFGPGSFKGVLLLCGKGMCEKDWGTHYGEQLSALANCWKDHFAPKQSSGQVGPDPHFFYTVPSKQLAPSITLPQGIQGRNTAVQIDHWLAAEPADKPGAAAAEKQMQAVIDQVVGEIYK